MNGDDAADEAETSSAGSAANEEECTGDCDKEKKERSEHAEERKKQADQGDDHRQVGDANRVKQQGREFYDTETGNTIHVDGGRAVVSSPEGKEITRFRNTRRNTQGRIRSGRWKPVE